MSLGDIVSADRQTPEVEHSIIGDLTRAMGTREPDHRAKGWHPSQLMDMCPRQEVLLRLKDGQIEKEDHPLRTKMIFDVGTALHAWWQEQYFGPMGVLKGRWRCARCGFKTTGMMKMPMYPHKCGVGTPVEGEPWVDDTDVKGKARVGHNRIWKFAEVPVKNEEWGIVGHSDGIYLLGKYGLTIQQIVEATLEIKTAGFTFWDGRKGHPYPENIFQINLYMWLTGKTKGVLLYIDKGGVDRDLLAMCKEVVVDYNDRHRKDACAKITAYRRSVENCKLPGRMAICELKPNSAKPKKCPARSICLSDKKSSAIEVASWDTVEML